MPVYGPGHTAVLVRGAVFTFEPTAGWPGLATGWKRYEQRDYLGKNVHRPIVLHTFDGSCDEKRTFNYILKNVAEDDDYMSSGVCCQKAVKALSKGFGQASLRVAGVNTPRNVSRWASRHKSLKAIDLVWSPPSGQSAKIARDFEEIIYDWTDGKRGTAPA